MRQDFTPHDLGCACLALLPFIIISVFAALLVVAICQPVSADTMILYPNEDRQIQREVAGSNFTSLATGAGTYNTLGATMGVIVLGDTGTNTYSLLRAYGVTFNTTLLPTNSTITNASLTLAYSNKLNEQGTPSLVITKFNPANYLSIADNNNYQKFINTSIGSISYASFSEGNNTIYLSDLTAVNKSGITALGARLNWHVDQGATGPTWASGSLPSGFYFYTSAQAGQDKDPFLTIVYTPGGDTAPTTLPGTCIFTNITGAALGENSTEWSVTQGDYTWGTLITNASQGNISYYVCPKAPDPWAPEINPPSPDSLIGTVKLWIKQTLKDVLE